MLERRLSDAAAAAATIENVFFENKLSRFQNITTEKYFLFYDLSFSNLNCYSHVFSHS